jgi:hypothetical protein
MVNIEIVNRIANECSNVSVRDIGTWKEMVLLLKQQALLAGSISVLPQLATIVEEIFFVTGLLYFNIGGLINGSKSISSLRTIFPCVMIIWHSLRQYVKFIVADSVQEEVQL